MNEFSLWLNPKKKEDELIFIYYILFASFMMIACFKRFFWLLGIIKDKQYSNVIIVLESK